MRVIAAPKHSPLPVPRQRDEHGFTHELRGFLVAAYRETACRRFLKGCICPRCLFVQDRLDHVRGRERLRLVVGSAGAAD